MRLNREKAQILLQNRGWSEVTFSRKLNLDYSYVYRVMRGKRGVGKKFLKGLILLCEEEGINFKEYIFFDEECQECERKTNLELSQLD